MTIIIKNLDRTLDHESMSAVCGGAWAYAAMDMFNLQSVVADSQKQTQVAASITHAINDGTMQVIGNIK
jgi:hypothetical protein